MIADLGQIYMLWFVALIFGQDKVGSKSVNTNPTSWLIWKNQWPLNRFSCVGPNFLNVITACKRIDLTDILGLLWENRVIDLFPPFYFVSRSSDSFSPSGKTHLLSLSLHSSPPCLSWPPSASLPLWCAIATMHWFCCWSMRSTCPIRKKVEAQQITSAVF